jgi:hypothetical protein
LHFSEVKTTNTFPENLSRNLIEEPSTFLESFPILEPHPGTTINNGAPPVIKWVFQQQENLP